MASRKLVAGIAACCGSTGLPDGRPRHAGASGLGAGFQLVALLLAPTHSAFWDFL